MRRVLDRLPHTRDAEVEVHEVAALDEGALLRHGEEATGRGAVPARSLDAKVRLEPRRHALSPQGVEQEAPHIPNRGLPRGDGLVRQGSPSEHLGQMDEGLEVGELLRDARVEVVLDERLGAHEPPGALGPERIAQHPVARPRQAARHSTMPFDRQANALRRIRLVQIPQDLLGRKCPAAALEDPLDTLLRVAGQGDLAEAVLVGVDEDEDVAVARIRAGRGDEGCERIAVELLVDDDPPIQAMSAHHAEKHAMALCQPLVALADLLRPGQQPGHLVPRGGEGSRVFGRHRHAERACGDDGKDLSHGSTSC